MKGDIKCGKRDGLGLLGETQELEIAPYNSAYEESSY